MKKNRYIMYAIALLQGMVFYGPVATLYRQANGVTMLEISIIESISLALCIFLEVPWGIIADKVGYRKTMIFCSGLYFVSKIVFWQAQGFGGFLLERILLSVVLAGFSGVDSSILYLSSDGVDSQKVFGVYNGISMAGLLLAAAVFSCFVGDNYRLAGFLTVLSYGLAALLSWQLTEVRPISTQKAKKEPFLKTIGQTCRNRLLLLFLIAAAFLTETHQTITVFLNQLQYERCGLNSSAMGVIYIAATLLGLLGFCSSAITRRVGLRRSFMLFCGLSAVSCLVLGAVQYAVPSVVSILTLRLSNTLFQPFQAELQHRQVQTENRATALSVNAMLMDGVAIGTNLLFGILADRHLPSAFFFGGILCVLGLMLFSIWFRKTDVRKLYGHSVIT